MNKKRLYYISKENLRLNVCNNTFILNQRKDLFLGRKMANQVQNEPTAAYILSLIGGIIGLLISLGLVAWGALVTIGIGGVGGFYYGELVAIMVTYLGIGIWCLITSILIIIFARKLKANPLQHSKWGALILVFSIIGPAGLLALIGGILALVYKPIPYGASPQYGPQQPYYGPPPQQAAYQQSPTTICPQCGTAVASNVRFCPNCGRQVN